jgi:hypothetical protein
MIPQIINKMMSDNSFGLGRNVLKCHFVLIDDDQNIT